MFSFSSGRNRRCVSFHRSIFYKSNTKNLKSKINLIDSYLTIYDSSSAEIKISKSKFISQSFPLNSKSEVQRYLSEVKKKNFDAAHFPYACRIGIDKNHFKYTDDGEPSGSGGKPILEAIDKFNLTNILVIVTRYFGGIKLGAGGLRRAFFEAAELCLKQSSIIEKLITEKLNIEFEYRFMNLIMKMIDEEKIKLIKNNSGEKCNLILEVRLSKVEEIKSGLIALTNGNIIIY